MSDTNGQGHRYRVSATGFARAEYLDIVRRAEQIGRGPEITAALRSLMKELTADPHRFGEPLYHLRHMKMLVRNGGVGGLYVEFGVHDERPVVIVRRVRWLGDPLPG